MPTKTIGKLSIRSSDFRDILFSQILQNNDSVADTEPSTLSDNESFEPMRAYVALDCFDLAASTKHIEVIYEDYYNAANAIDANYKVTLTLLYEEEEA